MIVKIYEHPRADFQPDEIRETVWHMSVTTANGVEIKISDDHGVLHLHVNGQMIVEPDAANSIHIYERHI